MGIRTCERCGGPVIKEACRVCKAPAGSSGSASSARPMWQGRSQATSPLPRSPATSGPPLNPSSTSAARPGAEPQPVSVQPLSESVVHRWDGSLTVTGIVSNVQPERLESVSTEASDQLGHFAGQLFTLPFRALGIVLGVIFAPLRLLLGLSLMGMGGKKRSSERIQLVGTPFRVEADDGSVHQCFIRGEMRGGAIHLGDRVEVTGRLSRRSNVLQVAQATDLRSGARSHGHVPASARNLTAKAIVQVALAVLVLLFLLHSCALGRAGL